MAVYLLHFDVPFQHARHYVGFTTDIFQRVQAHQRGQSARLMRVLKDHGIGFTVAGYWREGTKKDERAMKKRRATPQLCPICNPALAERNRLALPLYPVRRGVYATYDGRHTVEKRGNLWFYTAAGRSGMGWKTRRQATLRLVSVLRKSTESGLRLPLV